MSMDEQWAREHIGMTPAVGMTADKIAEMRDAIENHPHFSLGGDALSVILDDLEAARAHIAQLEAQRGGAVVAPDRAGWVAILEIDALRSFYEIVRCHMMAEGGIPMSDALGSAMDALDEIRDRAQQAKGE